MIGTITFTAICDIAWVEPFWIFAISLFFCGISLFLAPLCYNFATFTALSLSFGFFASSLALTPIVTVTVYLAYKIRLKDLSVPQALQYTRYLDPADFSSAVFTHAHFQKKLDIQLMQFLLQ